MWRRLLRPLCAVSAILLASGLQPLASTQSSDGETVRVRRIVSLVPNVTEMLFAIGAGDRVVGVSSFDEYPPAVKKIARVGGLLDPDLERIFALRPELVVVYGSQRELQAQLQQAGMRTYSYRHGGVADITGIMRELGAMLGTEPQAEAAAKQIESGLARIRARVSGLRRPRVLLVFGREKGALRGIYASGGVGFLHDLVEIGGGQDVFADIKRESVQASTELILSRAPEVIIEIHGSEVLSSDTAAREAAEWTVLSSVPAVQHRRVYVLSGQELVTPGPRIVRAAEQISRAIHPDTD